MSMSERGEHLTDFDLLDRYGGLIAAARSIDAQGYPVTMERLCDAVGGRWSPSRIGKIRSVLIGRGLWSWGIVTNTLTEDQYDQKCQDVLRAARAVDAEGNQVTLERIKKAMGGAMSESRISKIRTVLFGRGIWPWAIQIGAVDRSKLPKLSGLRKYDYEPTPEEMRAEARRIIAEWAERALQSEKRVTKPPRPPQTNAEACAAMVKEWRHRTRRTRTSARTREVAA
jgi:hypothetical protein